jgi:hypothetical protein
MAVRERESLDPISPSWMETEVLSCNDRLNERQEISCYHLSTGMELDPNPCVNVHGKAQILDSMGTMFGPPAQDIQVAPDSQSTLLNCKLLPTVRWI